MKNKFKKIRNYFKKSFQRENGFIAIYLLIAISVTVTLLTGLIVFVSSSQRRSSDNVSRHQALEIAEIGIYNYKWYLAHSLDGKNTQQIKEFWQTGNARGIVENYEQEINDFHGEAVGKYEISVDPPDLDSTIILVTSTGWNYRHPHIKKSVKVRFRRPSWCEYSVLANDIVRFGEGTDIYGEVHSNSGIRFDGVAHNIVNSAVEIYYDPDTEQDQPGVWTSQSNEDNVFLAGKQFPTSLIDFNGVIGDLAYMKEQAQANGLFFSEGSYEGENCKWRHGLHWCGHPFWCWICETESIELAGYHIILNTNDTFELRKVYECQGDEWYEPKTYKIIQEGDAQVYNFPDNGLVFLENNVWIDGQINTARLTIVAADLSSSNETNVYINDNILYTNKDGQDVLGIIAEDDISVGLFSLNDLEIDAAMLARKGRIGRDYYSENNSSQFYKRNSITVFGSIATNERYGFAWSDGTGYAIRNIYFDNNLLYYPPPFFPTGTVYELDLWEDL